jgi:hypothetical protein
MNRQLTEFLRVLKMTPSLTPQQYRTLRGQAINGDLAGAKKGYARLMQRSVSHGHRENQSGASQPRRI